MGELRKAIWVKSPDQIGMLEKVTAAIASKGVNIQAIVAYEQDEEAIFDLILSDNEKAKEAIMELGFYLEERERVLIELEDEAGKLKNISSEIAQAGINLNYIYGTVAADTGKALLIIDSSDNHKLAEII
ncbi:MAG: hypothetical protein KKH98_08280 [Spirochaetes bacterium]|nr:hypothetical protein [Spirochaetota bacterium]